MCTQMPCICTSHLQSHAISAYSMGILPPRHTHRDTHTTSHGLHILSSSENKRLNSRTFYQSRNSAHFSNRPHTHRHETSKQRSEAFEVLAAAATASAGALTFATLATVQPAFRTVLHCHIAMSFPHFSCCLCLNVLSRKSSYSTPYYGSEFLDILMYVILNLFV